MVHNFPFQIPCFRVILGNSELWDCTLQTKGKSVELECRMEIIPYAFFDFLLDHSVTTKVKVLFREEPQENSIVTHTWSARSITRSDSLWMSLFRAIQTVPELTLDVLYGAKCLCTLTC